MKAKFLVLLLTVLTFALIFAGCDSRVTRDEAKEQTNLFLNAVEDKNYDLAKTYLHPQRPIDVKALTERAELNLGIDFSKGIEITRYTDFSSSVYDSEVDGSEYELEIDAIVGGVSIEINVEIVRNDQGFGIYGIEFDD